MPCRAKAVGIVHRSIRDARTGKCSFAWNMPCTVMSSVQIQHRLYVLVHRAGNPRLVEQAGANRRVALELASIVPAPDTEPGWLAVHASRSPLPGNDSCPCASSMRWTAVSEGRLALRLM